MFGSSGGADCAPPKECGANSTCVRGSKRWNKFLPDYRCVCDEGFIEVNNECRDCESSSL